MVISLFVILWALITITVKITVKTVLIIRVIWKNVTYNDGFDPISCFTEILIRIRESYWSIPHESVWFVNHTESIPHGSIWFVKHTELYHTKRVCFVNHTEVYHTHVYYSWITLKSIPHERMFSWIILNIPHERTWFVKIIPKYTTRNVCDSWVIMKYSTRTCMIRESYWIIPHERMWFVNHTEVYHTNVYETCFVQAKRMYSTDFFVLGESRQERTGPYGHWTII